MDSPAEQPKPPTSGKYSLILLCALIGFGVALGGVALLPLESETGIGLAYPAVSALAGVSIAVIFRLFVRRA